MKRSFFTTALVSTSLSLGLAGLGEAVVIWTSNVDIPIPTTFEGIYIDLDTGGGGGPVASGTTPFAGADANFFFGGFVVANDAGGPGLSTPTWQPVRLAADNTSSVDNIPFGGLIGPASPVGDDFGGSLDHLGATFTAGVPGYLGFSINSSGQTLYGWMYVTLDVNPSEGVIHTWAIQDNGDAIAAGVPEPATSVLGLLAVGALALRRRR